MVVVSMSWDGLFVGWILFVFFFFCCPIFVYEVLQFFAFFLVGLAGLFWPVLVIGDTCLMQVLDFV